MSRIINQNTEPLFIFDMPDDETLSQVISVKGEKGEKGDPTKLSELDNDTGFITSSASDLVNYYTKTTTDSLLNAKLDESTFNAYEIPEDFYTGPETISASGSSITLSGTEAAPLISVAFYGDLAQNGTPSISQPADINVVTGEQTVTITGDSSQIYDLSLGDIELCKIGTYQDRIYKNNGTWFLHKEIESITLDGSEDWRATSGANPYYSVDTIQAVGNYCAGYCTHFVNKKGYPSSTGYFAIRADGTSISCYNSSIESLPDWKTWLASNTPTVYYPLSVSTDEEITDEELVAQLNAIADAKTYRGVTGIAASGSLAVVLAVTAYKSNWNGTISGVNDSISRKADMSVVDKKPYCFDSIAEMKAADLKIGHIAETTGYYANNDAGAGKYRILDVEDTADNGSVIALDNGLKAVLIVESGTVNVRQFGARGDGLINDTQAIQNCINFAKENTFSIYVPSGTYRVWQIVFDYEGAYIYGDYINSVIKSAANSSVSSIVKFEENAIIKSTIRDLVIDGNKDNNAATIDGLVFTSTAEYGDSYSLIDHVIVRNCTGNGINLDGSKIREFRLSNSRGESNNLNGFKVNEITDSLIYNCTASFNKQSGFMVKGSNHKISGCKAHTNGAGDGVTVDQERSPSSAYEVTQDSTPQTGKTYYVRSGSGYNDDPYVFAEFEGNTFVSGTAYYELTKTYLKRYYGFYIEGKENTLTTCEAQDNQGDGYYVNGGNNNLVGVLADNNGRLGNNTSYEDVGLEQIYDGVHLEPWGNNNVVGTFANFRQRLNEGLCQRSALCVKSSSGKCNASIITDSQVYDVLVFNQGSTNTNNIVVNGEGYYDEYDVTRLSLYTGCTLQTKSSSTINYSYLKKKGERKYLKLIVTNSNGFQTNGDYVLLTLPARFRPKNVVTMHGTVSNVKGYNINGTANIVINPDGTMQYRGSTAARNDLVVICEYE